MSHQGIDIVHQRQHQLVDELYRRLGELNFPQWKRLSAPHRAQLDVIRSMITWVLNILGSRQIGLEPETQLANVLKRLKYNQAREFEQSLEIGADIEDLWSYIVEGLLYLLNVLFPPLAEIQVNTAYEGLASLAESANIFKYQAENRIENSNINLEEVQIQLQDHMLTYSARFKKEIDEAKKQIAELTDRQSRLRDEEDDRILLDQALEEAEKKAKSCEQVAERTTELAKINKAEMEDAHKELQSLIDEEQASTAKLEAFRAALEAENKSIEDLQEESAELETLRAENAELDTQFQAVQDSLKSESKQAQKQISILEDKLAAILPSDVPFTSPLPITGIDTIPSVSSTKDYTFKIDVKIGELTEEADELNIENTNLVGEIQALENNVSATRAQLDDYRQKRTEAEISSAKVRKLYENSTNQDASRWVSLKQSRREQIVSLKSELVQLRTELTNQKNIALDIEERERTQVEPLREVVNQTNKDIGSLCEKLMTPVQEATQMYVEVGDLLKLVRTGIHDLEYAETTAITSEIPGVDELMEMRQKSIEQLTQLSPQTPPEDKILP